MGDAFITRRGGAGGGLTIKNSEKIEARTQTGDVQANMFISNLPGIPYTLLDRSTDSVVNNTSEVNLYTPFSKYIIPGEAEDEAVLVSLVLDSYTSSTTLVQSKHYIKLDKRINGGEWEYQGISILPTSGYYTNTGSIKFVPIEGNERLFAIVSFGSPSSASPNGYVYLVVDIVEIVPPYSIATRAGDADSGGGGNNTGWEAVHLGRVTKAGVQATNSIGSNANAYDVHTFKDGLGNYSIVVVYNQLDVYSKMLTTVTYIKIDPQYSMKSTSATVNSATSYNSTSVRSIFTKLDDREIFEEDATNIYGRRLVIAEGKGYSSGTFSSVSLSYVTLESLSTGSISIAPSKSVSHSVADTSASTLNSAFLSKRKGTDLYFFAYPSSSYYAATPFSLPSTSIVSTAAPTLGTAIKTSARSDVVSGRFSIQPLYDIDNDEVGAIVINTISVGFMCTAFAMRDNGTSRYFSSSSSYDFLSIPFYDRDDLSIRNFTNTPMYRWSGKLPYYIDSKGNSYGYMTTVDLYTQSGTKVITVPLVFSIKISPIDLTTEDNIYPIGTPLLKLLMITRPSVTNYSVFIAKGVVTLPRVKEENSSIAGFDGGSNAANVIGIYNNLPNLSKLGQLYVKETESGVLPFGVSLTPITKDTGSALVVKQ